MLSTADDRRCLARKSDRVIRKGGFFLSDLADAVRTFVMPEPEVVESRGSDHRGVQVWKRVSGRGDDLPDEGKDVGRQCPGYWGTARPIVWDVGTHAWLRGGH